ncbi:MAG: DPP IV N-terminal domain-containing protein [Planctomycetaceae bacterium]|jgi:TolB protein|nr:PD40 domain-containing protein [Phycisphaerales bacterium]MCE2652253.1 DPP IV N-terminal domain-containing protein [Planctomycetaceae bacterium]
MALVTGKRNGMTASDHLVLAAAAGLTLTGCAGGPGSLQVGTAPSAPMTGAGNSGVMTPAPAVVNGAEGENTQALSAAKSSGAESGGITLGETLEGLMQNTFGGHGADMDPAVSRDGGFMVFSSTQHRPSADLYIKQVGSKAVTQLTLDPGNDVMPAISPDGKRIAFASDRSGFWNIYVMPTRGGQPVQITNERTADLHPSWSPDGTRLVFCRLGQMSGRWELWTVNVGQSNQQEFIGYGMLPEYCPVPGTGEDGADRITFQRSRERGDQAFGVWIVDYKPGSVSNPTEIVAGSDFAAINPTWSPDGKFVAYSRMSPEQAPMPANSGRPTRADIWMTAVATGTSVNLTAGRHANLNPTWAGDGRLYFLSDRNGRENVWSIATERALTAASAQPGAPMKTPAVAGVKDNE